MSDIGRLIALMAQLRDPRAGCPWDLEQTFQTISPYTIEEAYEVADAIDRGNPADLLDELGDLLFQVVFHARLAEEEGFFTFGDVVEAVVEKMIRRHPHVFGESRVESAEAQAAAWESHKTEERRSLGNDDGSLMDGITRSLPPLRKALKLQLKAARVAFDWEEAVQVVEKLREELDELSAALRLSAGGTSVAEETGDIFFTCVNLARHLVSCPGNI